MIFEMDTERLPSTAACEAVHNLHHALRTIPVDLVLVRAHASCRVTPVSKLALTLYARRKFHNDKSELLRALERGQVTLVYFTISTINQRCRHLFHDRRRCGLIVEPCYGEIGLGYDLQAICTIEIPDGASNHACTTGSAENNQSGTLRIEFGRNG